MPIVGCNDRKIHFENGLQISYNVKLSEWKGDLPLQMCIIVSHNNAHVMTYGAENEQDNADLTYLWRTLERRAHGEDSDQKQRDCREGYALLHKGLQ